MNYFRAFVYEGEIVPYVRMTQRGKFVKPDAQRYLASKDALGWFMRETMVKWGPERLQDKTPFKLTMNLCRPDVFRFDLDNAVKAVLDAAQGIMFADDRYCVIVEAMKASGEQVCEFDFEAVEDLNG